MFPIWSQQLLSFSTEQAFTSSHPVWWQQRFGVEYVASQSLFSCQRFLKDWRMKSKSLHILNSNLIKDSSVKMEILLFYFSIWPLYSIRTWDNGRIIHFLRRKFNDSWDKMCVSSSPCGSMPLLSWQQSLKSMLQQRKWLFLHIAHPVISCQISGED